MYFDREHQTDAAKILPGEYYATGRDISLVTVLGSCVCACIGDRSIGIGGMNHFMLPGRCNGDNTLLGDSARYGVYAMEVLINQLLKMGARRSNLEAKVFGGASVLKGFTSSSIGERNSIFVLNYLKTENIAVTAQDMLGTLPRKVYYFPVTGRVRVKELKSTQNNTIFSRESEYKHLLQRKKMDGDVEIFNQSPREFTRF